MVHATIFFMMTELLFVSIIEIYVKLFKIDKPIFFYNYEQRCDHIPQFCLGLEYTTQSQINFLSLACCYIVRNNVNDILCSLPLLHPQGENKDTIKTLSPLPLTNTKWYSFLFGLNGLSQNFQILHYISLTLSLIQLKYFESHAIFNKSIEMRGRE